MDMTPEQLQTILGDHGKWIRGEVDGKRANLTRANLTRANLDGANLDGANLDGANLKRANLTRANLDGANLTRAKLEKAKVDDNTNITGEPWKDYLEKVLPALLTAGGKTVEQVVGTGCWTCHEWQNCPMHEAFGINHASEGPFLLRPRIEQFVQLFDADLIPCPVIVVPAVCSADSQAAV